MSSQFKTRFFSGSQLGVILLILCSLVFFQNCAEGPKTSESKNTTAATPTPDPTPTPTPAQLSFSEPGTFGIFDPSLMSDSSNIYMTYSSASTTTTAGASPNYYTWLITTRWAQSGDSGATWTDMGVLFPASEFTLNTHPAAVDYEVSSLVYDPAATANERWRVFVHEYWQQGAGKLAATMSIRMKSASSIAGLGAAASRKIFAGKAHTDTSPVPMPEITLSSLSSDLTNCAGLSEPGGVASNGHLYLAMTCYTVSATTDFVFLLKYNNTTTQWSYIGKLLTNTDATLYSTTRLTAANLNVTPSGNFIIVSPETGGNYKGCYVFKMSSDFDSTSIVRDSNLKPVAYQTVTSTATHVGACAYDSMSASTIGIMPFQTDLTAGLPFAKSFRSYISF